MTHTIFDGYLSREMAATNTYVYGENCAFRLLAEFSLSEMKVEVRDKTGAHAMSLKELEQMKLFHIGNRTWDVLWRRQESDERGPYTAVGLVLKIQ